MNTLTTCNTYTRRST